MSGVLASLLTVLVLAVVHAYSGTLSALHHEWRSRTLSAAGGVASSYVFLELIPSLAEQDEIIEELELFPALDEGVYILALTGLIIAFWVETAARGSRRKQRQAGAEDVTQAGVFWFSIAAFFILNAAAGYGVASPGDESVDPLWLFAIAMGLHLLVNDHSLAEHHGERYRRVGRWVLAASLLVGWGIGIAPGLDIPEGAVAAVLAYLAGGMIMNILRHELPDTDRTADVAAFVIGAAAHGALLLSLGPV